MAIERRVAEDRPPNGKILAEKKFTSDKQALDYVAREIATEATRQGIPLSEVERKMLYFSETDWTLPDIQEVCAEFERDYNEGEYEQKIARLVHSIDSQLKNADDQASNAWYAAIQKLSNGDRYLLVLLGQNLSKASKSARPLTDLTKLSFTTLGIMLGWIAFVTIADRPFGDRIRAAMDWLFDRHHFYLVVLAAILVWALRWKLIGLLLTLWNRE